MLFMTTGIGGYEEKLPGNVPGLSNEAYKKKVLDNLDRFIRETEFDGKKNWPPQYFLDPKMKKELINKLHELTKGFPFDQFEIVDLLKILQERRIRV